jgi:hypothetical protein
LKQERAAISDGFGALPNSSRTSQMTALFSLEKSVDFHIRLARRIDAVPLTRDYLYRTRI